MNKIAIGKKKDLWAIFGNLLSHISMAKDLQPKLDWGKSS